MLSWHAPVCHWLLANLLSSHLELRFATAQAVAAAAARPELAAERRAQVHFWVNLAKACSLEPQLHHAGIAQAPVPRAGHSRSRVRRGAAMALLRRGVSALREERVAPRRIVMNLEKVDDSVLNATLQKDELAVQSASVSFSKELSQRLVAALRDIRCLENRSSWLLQWALERLHHFGMPSNASAGDYGVTWFSGWQTLVNKALVSASGAVPLLAPLQGVKVVVIGGALGYQCLYALALGAVGCTSYDVLCRGLCQPAERIMQDHGLGRHVSIRCEDGQYVTGLADAGLLWINDQSYPLALRRSILQKAAAGLQSGAIAVVYSQPVAARWRARDLPILYRVRVKTSWGSAQAFVLRKA
eukprot:TRINITY_DN102043_c0_g1_i1.p1 TRINITY_DN102043_c0_g1~~TRINITY_DN102043_c0_g1_i1.p1  ORF type:complete len:369 (-),score=49.65 TRINITY_DN102043_c0_g1_i1:394-1467(-)